MYVYGGCLFYDCCTACVGVCGNGCVVAVVKDSVLSLEVLKYVACGCKGCDDVVFSVCIERHGTVSRVYNHLLTTTTNHYFRLSRIHLQSFIMKAISPFSHTSTKLLHCWCHND